MPLTNTLSPSWLSVVRLGAAVCCCCSLRRVAAGGVSQLTSSPVTKNAARLVKLSAYPNAKCLDGSTAGYYFRNGTSGNFLIWMEGGGWCYDSNCKNPTHSGTLNDCRERAKTNLGSSIYWPLIEDSYLQGVLNADPAANPVFHDWSLVYMRYCDGTSFSGDKVVGSLHFRGQAILAAVLADLRATTEIREAQSVVFGGGSAGASAVFYHVDNVADQLALKKGEVMGLPDAGFFLDLPDKDGIDCWPAQMRSIFEVSGGYASLHQGCLARFPKETWKCLFPEYYVDLISSRLFVIHSLYDQSEVEYTLRLNCCATPGWCWHHQARCSANDQQLFEALREQHVKAWAPLKNKHGNALWAPACEVHTMTWKSWVDPSWEVPAGSGHTMAASVKSWLHGESNIYQDNASWPSNRPCSGLDYFDNLV
eukprot:TRINITY_DN32572_c0_g1_i1.p1 TRINITY_DN32572_c0_g1~~TRINITY_DN32572_c0_g1_i1.p1  ORF type:complete len:423 (-),score=61.80 TRINITY_DN32572_c0_g1_i1:36-1304(-)